MYIKSLRHWRAWISGVTDKLGGAELKLVMAMAGGAMAACPGTASKAARKDSARKDSKDSRPEFSRFATWTLQKGCQMNGIRVPFSNPYRVETPQICRVLVYLLSQRTMK